MGAEPVHLLGDVDLLGQQDHLLLQPGGIELGAHLLEPGQQPLALGGEHLRHPGPDPLHLGTHRRESLLDESAQLGTLPGPRLQQLGDRLVEQFQQRRLERFRIGLLGADDPGPAQYVH